MKIWSRSVLIGFVVAGITWLALYWIEKKKNSGLYDAEYVLAQTEESRRGTVDDIVAILSQRIRYKYPGSLIRYTKENYFVVFMKKIRDTIQPVKLLTSRGKLRFCETFAASDIQPALMAFIQLTEKESMTEKSASLQEPGPPKDISEQTRALLDTVVKDEKSVKTANLNLINFNEGTPSGQLGVVSIEDTAHIRTLLEKPEVAGKLSRNTMFCFGLPVHRSDKKQKLPLFAVKITKTEDLMSLDNSSVVDARQDYNYRNEPTVIFTFDNHGTRIWQKLTRDNIGKAIAILLDDIVVSAPVVQEQLNGSSSEIAANFSVDEAQNLALFISTRPLPGRLELVYSSVKPHKGADSSRQLLISFAALVLFSIISFLVLKTLKTT